MEVQVRSQVSPSRIKHSAKAGLYRNYIKRPMDIVLSLCAFIVLSPVLIVTAVLVRNKLGSPIIFKQERPGLNKKLFTLYKFRTMTDERDENGELLPDEIRLTKFGRFLRSTSLDELPELFNILKGDMSVVGPRPLLFQYLQLYDTQQRRRHEVRPGLSGLAQINGRNATTWEERLNLDVQYVDSVSFVLDWKIILVTIKNAGKRQGISQAGQATMEVFKGSKNILIIIGAGGHGKVVADIALKMGKWQKILFLDDNEFNKSVIGLKVIGKSTDAHKFIPNSDVFIAVGNNDRREEIQNVLKRKGASIPVLVHPTAIIGEEVELKEGTVVMAGVIINSGSRIGKGCIINTGATIDHDNILEDYVHISPGVHTAGNVKVQKNTWIGIGASVSNNVTITRGCVIGAGAVVLNNIHKTGTYVGVPVKGV